MKKKIQKLIKNKYFLVYVCIFIVLLICLISIKNFLFPSNSNTNYGNRLDGIKDVPFTKSDQKKIIGWFFYVDLLLLFTYYIQ